ncbi:hypothetical protein DFJ74DRAFT_682772 [Hyaloraphidium curvatum]|nr:hypothetical protein DFJ74DRAFT_682772 [Hyaloraphidium curvatum]
MRILSSPVVALGVVLGLATSAAGQAASRTAAAGSKSVASAKNTAVLGAQTVKATLTRTAATALATETLSLWDPDKCAPENFGGKHHWSPGDCGIIERYLSQNWVALYQKNTSNTATGCDRWYWEYGKKDSCCGFWWQWEDHIICDAYGRVVDSPWNNVIDFGPIHDNFEPPEYQCVPTNPTTGERPGPWSCIQSPKDHKNWIVARRVRVPGSVLDDVEALVIENTEEGKGGFWSGTREGCLWGRQFYLERQISEPFRCEVGGYEWEPPHWCRTGRMGLPPPNDTNVPCADGTQWVAPKYLPETTNNSWALVSRLMNGTTPIELLADPYNGINADAPVNYTYVSGATSRSVSKKTTTTTTTTTITAATLTSTSRTLPGIYITTTTEEESAAAPLRLGFTLLGAVVAAAAVLLA